MKKSVTLTFLLGGIGFLWALQVVCQPLDLELREKRNPDDYSKVLNIGTLQEELKQELNMSSEDIGWFFGHYAVDFTATKKYILIENYKSGKLTATTAPSYRAQLKNGYLKEYETYLANKTSFIAEQRKLTNARVEAANEPCTNMGFESGDFTGWVGAIQVRDADGNDDNGYTAGPLSSGFRQHCIMTPSMRDPYFADLPVVPPGKTNAIRLGNVVQGGQRATLSQTFRVSKDNELFTYRYAVVLEHPAGANGHDGLDAPHFQARLKTSNGAIVPCSEYSAIVIDDLDDYKYVCVDYQNNGINDNNRVMNIGCPASGNAQYNSTLSPANPQVTPGPIDPNPNDNNRVTCGNSNIDGDDIYYKSWSTVSIVLTQYIGQDVTIEFITADCSPGGHKGYAYVHAECSPIDVSLPGTICAPEQKVIIGSPGFKAYSWVATNGGHIVKDADKQIVTIDQPGRYTVTLTPYADNSPSNPANCTFQVVYDALPLCPPKPFTKTFCATDKANQTQATGVDLTSFNGDALTGFPATFSVLSWHKGEPRANNIVNPATNVTVANGDKFYAVLKSASRNDTVQMNVIVNPKPDAKFNDIPNLCKDAPKYQITGATAGGIFSGTPFVTTTGEFTPSTIGTYNIKHVLKNNTTGCKDSVTKTALVQSVPSVQVDGDTTVCFTGTAISLPLKAIVGPGDQVEWTSATGNIANRNAANTTITIDANGAVPFEQQIKVDVVSRSNSCPDATASVTIRTRQLPTVTVNGDISICSPNGIASFDAEGTVNYQDSVRWTGTNISFSSPKTPISPASVSQLGSFTAELTAYKEFCPVVKKSFVVTTGSGPTVDLPRDTIICSGTSPTLLNIVAKSVGSADSIVWRSSGISPIPKIGPTSSVLMPEDTQFKVYVTAYKQGCDPVSDSMDIRYEEAPKITASIQYTCEPDMRVLLTGQSTKAGKVAHGKWSSSGAGMFASSVDIVTSNIYRPSSQEIASGNASIKLSSVGQVHCQVKDTTLPLTIIALPLANAGTDSVLCLQSRFSRTLPSNASWKYDWKLAPSTSLSSTSSVSFVPTADTSKIVLTVVNARNCKATDSIYVATVVPPTLSITPKICHYKPTQVTATVTNPPAAGDYFWTKGSLKTGDILSTITLGSAGTYAYNYVFQGCSTSTSIVALVPPTLNVTVPPACENTSITLRANQLPEAKYYWNSPAIGTSTFPTNVGSGLSNFQVIVEDKDGCRDTTVVNVPVSPYPSFTLASQEICEGETGTITAQLNDPSLLTKYTLHPEWKKDGHSFPGGHAWHTLHSTQAGNYSLDLGINGCVVSKTIPLVVRSAPQIETPPYKYCYETDAPLSIGSTTFDKHRWYTEDGTLINTAPVISVTPHEDTRYGLKVWNTFGCTDSATVLVRKVCPPRLFVPNVITPHSQDVNARLQIFGAHYTNFEITIFNRWGEAIFNSKDPEKMWDGVYLKENMPIGVFPWIVTYEGDSEEHKGPYKKVGEVTVVR